MANLISEVQAIPIGPRDAGRPLTLDKFDAAEFEEGLLLHGVLLVTPPALEEERDAKGELGHWLRNDQESHPAGPALDLTLRRPAS